jgi:hypothetical protein
MKTFADLKRDLIVGKTLTMTFNSLEGSSETIKKRIGVARKILKTQTNGITLEFEEGSGKGSFLELPCASLIEYDGNTIRVYKYGKRDLTVREAEILANRPSERPENAEILRMDMLSDGNQCFWKDKKYYNDNDANWYWEWDKGLKYNMSENKMWDKKIKGELEMEYILN